MAISLITGTIKKKAKFNIKNIKPIKDVDK